MYRNFFLYLLSCLFLAGEAFSQNGIEEPDQRNDTFQQETVVFSASAASEYITGLIGMQNLWKQENDTLRLSLMRLIDHFGEPYDSVRTRLAKHPYGASDFMHTVIFHRDTFPVRWLDNEVFIVDTTVLKKDPVIKQHTLVTRVLEVDTAAFHLPDTVHDIRAIIDSVFRATLRVSDTITSFFVDYAYLESKNIIVHRLENETVKPPLLPPESTKTITFFSDSSGFVVSEAVPAIKAGPGSPFDIVPGIYMLDSLTAAVETLLRHTYERDSILLFISDISGRKIPFWLSGGKDDPYRLWVSNVKNDSITIWLANPDKFDLTMILEEEVSVERLQKKTADDIPIATLTPETSLLSLNPLQEIPVYWNYLFTSAFSLNQNYLANWSRGGESSLSGMFDVRAEAKYANKDSETTWTSSGRIRYGSIRTKEQGVRTSTDIFEINSQYNKRIANKLDFSSVFYGKTQVARGFNYPNDSVVISKFLNPGTFTIGAGVEYKPFKETLVNFSALSYKNTFVLDTANINQVTHGVPAGMRARQEMGGQLVIRNRTNIMDGLSITNALRLFSNYLDKPKNVDVDWEMNLEQQINWLFTIRLNVHLIYDDDIRFPVLDKAGEPVLLPDGTPRKVPKTQFNQFLGLTMSIRI